MWTRLEGGSLGCVLLSEGLRAEEKTLVVGRRGRDGESDEWMRSNSEEVIEVIDGGYICMSQFFAMYLCCLDPP